MVGRVVGAHGIRGEIKVLPYGSSEELAALVRSKLYIGAEGEPVLHKVVQVRCHKMGLIVELAGVTTRSRAETLAGLEVSIDSDDLPALPEGEYYQSQLIGMEVRTSDGKGLGKIGNIISTGSNDVYEITGPNGEILIPAIKDVILEVDLDKNLITIKLPEGLEP